MRKILIPTLVVVPLTLISDQIPIVADVHPTPPAIQAQADPGAAARLQPQWDRYLQKLSREHEGLGKRYEKAGDLGEAIRHWKWALWLNKDNAAARKSLGYEKRGEEWVLVTLVKPPEAPDVSKLSPEARKKHEEEQKAIAKASEKVIADDEKHTASNLKELLSWHSKASKAEVAELANEALRTARWYGPGSQEIAQLRGFQGKSGALVYAPINRLVEAAVKAHADAPESAPVEGEDEQAAAAKVPVMHRASIEGKTYSARSSRDAARADAIARLMAGADAYAASLLGREKGVDFSRRGNYLYTELTSREQYSRWIDAHYAGQEDHKALAKKLSGTGGCRPNGHVAFTVMHDGGNDMIAHVFASTALNVMRGVSGDPWVQRGFGYMVTAHLLGSTSTRFFSAERSGRTSSTRKGEVDLDRKQGTPQRLRRICLEMLWMDEELTFRTISRTGVNDLTETHVAKAMGLFEYLCAEKPEVFKQWMSKSHGSADNDLGALLKLLETDEAGLQKQWSEWVLANY